MTSYSSAYKTLSIEILKTERKLIVEGSKDTKNPELREACKSILEAAKAE